MKFRKNQKSNSQLLTEAMGLNYRRDQYVMPLSEEELAYSDAYRSMNDIASDDLVVGLNTGCSITFPNKKLTVNQHVILARELSKREGVCLVLLGGPEDTERNAEIARQLREKVLSTPTTEGLRRGICYENICDVIITGDSLGMHIGIALKKYIIVWFGVSCPPEVDLFDRGVKLIPEGLACSPCWKRECPYDLECIQMVDLDGIVDAVERLRSMRREPAEKA
jgi:heptosyltransferase-2